jgi:hypothetical protein
LTKCRRFAQFLDSNPFYAKSISKCSLDGMDKQRKFVVWMLRLRCYFILQIVSTLKAYYLKKGKYDY